LSLFFDDALLEYIVNQTNLHARLHPFQWASYKWTDTSVNKIRSFLGIIIATGLVVLPNFEDYWRTNSIFSQPSITKGMTQNRFEHLCDWLHFNDNSLAPVHGTPGYNIGFTKLAQFLIQFVKKVCGCTTLGKKFQSMKPWLNLKAAHQSNSSNQ